MKDFFKDSVVDSIFHLQIVDFCHNWYNFTIYKWIVVPTKGALEKYFKQLIPLYSKNTTIKFDGWKWKIELKKLHWKLPWCHCQCLCNCYNHCKFLTNQVSTFGKFPVGYGGLDNMYVYLSNVSWTVLFRCQKFWLNDYQTSNENM